MSPNRLAREKSPYLLQHAHNPVDWYPWGEEAFEKAGREDKPILLSIGYSTCHWCHVMERESFENEGIARLMNELFVCVKLDREERPDVDKVYMTAVQALSGQGGWPLNVFLTPDGQPFFGGTYFPPEPRDGLASWPALLARISQLWKTRREDIVGDARKLTAALSEWAAAGQTAAAGAPKSEWLARAVEAYEGSFDERHAGFGGAPKFPMPVNQAFLLREWARTKDERPKRLALGTLRAMASGGVCDQVGGGFHRYSTDEQWRVPHFEKMLYDNAQLALNYVEAFQADADAVWARVARRTLDYLLRDLRHPQGAFFCAEDADSAPAAGEPKAEGAFYVWTQDELAAALGADAEAFALRYGVEQHGNALHDPHGELAGKNVLFVARSVGKIAAKLGVKEAELDARLEAAREKLLALRAKRPRPHLDDKVVTAWNGLAVGAFARAGAVLDEPRYLDAARAAARFLREQLYDEKSRSLWRRWRNGERAVPGTADDYAFLAQGLLELYEASFEPEWLEWSLALCEELAARFSAPGGGFYLTAEGADPRLLLRVVEDTDNVEPSASSAGALTMLRLCELVERPGLRRAAQAALARFAGAMDERPLSAAAMLCAAGFALSQPAQAVFVRAREAGPLLAQLRSRLLPQAVAAGVDEDSRSRVAALMPWAAEMKAAAGKPAAYVCRGRACRAPITDPGELARALEEEAA